MSGEVEYYVFKDVFYHNEYGSWRADELLDLFRVNTIDALLNLLRRADSSLSTQTNAGVDYYVVDIALTQSDVLGLLSEEDEDFEELLNEDISIESLEHRLSLLVDQETMYVYRLEQFMEVVFDFDGSIMTITLDEEGTYRLFNEPLNIEVPEEISGLVA